MTEKTKQEVVDVLVAVLADVQSRIRTSLVSLPSTSSSAAWRVAVAAHKLELDLQNALTRAIQAYQYGAGGDDDDDA